MMRKLLFIPVLFISFLSFGQDVHFSQFMNSSFLYNPGNTGLINGEHRFLVNYRSQWAGVADPYNTYSFTYDTKIFKKMTNKAQMGLGLGAFKDVAGDTEFGTTSILFSSSAMLKLDNFNTLSVGLQGGVMQNSINSNMRWGNQYDGNGYNAALSSNESGLVDATPFVGDFNAGVVWNYGTSEATITSNDLFSAQLGLSVNHLSRQRIKITDFNEKIYNRFTFHGKSFIGINNSPYAFIPGFIYQKQGPSAELVLGGYGRTKLKNESRYTGIFKESALSIGLFYRVGDALIPKLGFEIFNFNIGASYDLTTSGLSGGNAMEFSIQYLIPNQLTYGKGTSPKMY
jgi:type IX secretion system PorP/SprF family membrane protein